MPSEKPYKNRYWIGVYEIDEETRKETTCIAICESVNELLAFFNIDTSSCEANKMSKRLYWTLQRNKIRGNIRIKGVRYRLRKLPAYGPT